MSCPALFSASARLPGGGFGLVTEQGPGHVLRFPFQLRQVAAPVVRPGLLVGLHHGLGGLAELVSRSKVFARVRLRAGELDQASRDGQQAIRMATGVSESHRVRVHLRQLMDDATPYQREPAVRELREELKVAVAGSS